MGPVEQVVKLVEEHGHDFAAFERAMHLLASDEIALGNEWFAFKVLMVVEYTRESLS